MNQRIETLKAKAQDLPDLPGVYLMKNQAGAIIYIGKAKILKNRVSQYFTNVEKHQIKVYQMVMHVYDFNFIVTSSETEALILECSLIKQHAPKYNILLKDDKGYFYIKLSEEPYPRITSEKSKPADSSAKYLGPFTSAFTVNQSVEDANRIFMLPTCSKKFPRDIKKERPCLNYYIKKCMGVCTGCVSEKEYGEIFSQAVSFIKSGSKQTIKRLTEEMEAHSERLEFEKAAELRDRIKAISKVSEKQTVFLDNSKDTDFIAFVKAADKVCASVLTFKDGSLNDKTDFVFSDFLSDEEMREDFLMSYYSSPEKLPDEIVVDGEVEAKEIIEEYFSSQKNKTVKINTAPADKKLSALKMARENAAQKLTLIIGKRGAKIAALDSLAKALNLKTAPQYIESYDISNIGADAMVGVLVAFENGMPLKKAYKRFNIKDNLMPDDYKATCEIISRRFERYKSDEETDEGFKRMPDLILLDGGKGHVKAVKERLSEMGVSVEVFGVVKDDKHKARAIASDDGEIQIKRTSDIYSLIFQINEEVHRFAIEYHRKKKRKSLLSLELTKIEGVGEKRAVAVMKEFKTIKNLKAASPKEIAERCKGISPTLAEKIAQLVKNMP